MSSRLPHGVRWILFDAVGTLIYSDPPVAEAYRQVARQFGSQRTVAEIQQRFAAALAREFHGKTKLAQLPTSEQAERDRWRRVVASVLDDVSNSAGEPFERLWRHFGEPTSWRLFDDVQAILPALAARGYRLGVASNFDGRLRRIATGHAPLAACERVFVSSEVGFSKPDPRFFAAVQSQIDARPAEVLLVGDDCDNDICGAQNVGWSAVHIDRRATAEHGDSLCSLNELLM